MVCFAGGGVSCFFISCSHLVSIGKTLLSIAFLTRSAIPPQFHVGTSFVGRPFSQTHDVDKYEYLFNKRKLEGIKMPQQFPDYLAKSFEEYKNWQLYLKGVKPS